MKYDNNKMKWCKRLGALQFQKLVFLLEKVKYWIIEKFFPNTVEKYNKRLDKSMYKKLLKCNSEKERKEIINKYRFAKLKYKKEINTKENRNYHIDLNHPTEFINYLENNKRIHVNGFKSNIITTFIGIIICLILNNPYPIIFNSFLFIEFVSAIINLECINLQNYNLCRFHDERVQRILKNQEEKKKNRFEKDLSEGKKVIGRAFEKTSDIPTLDEVISQITNKREIEQLLGYAKKELNKKKNNDNVILDNERKYKYELHN